MAHADTAAREMLRFLFIFPAATRKDLAVAFSRTDSRIITRALDSLEGSGSAERKTFGRKEYVCLTRKGRDLAEKEVPPGTERPQLPTAKSVEEQTARREAFAFCMGASALSRSASGAPLLAFPWDKPDFGSLLGLMERDAAAGLLRGGIFYTSVEVKRYLREDGSAGKGSAGSESVTSSRICGILLKAEEAYVFYRSAGPIPRFNREAERKMLEALFCGRLDRWRGYGGGLSRFRPVAVMLSRSVQLIPSLVMGYSKGRVKSPESLDDRPFARHRRKYFENILFNPCCGLFGPVYCLDYSKRALKDSAGLLHYPRREYSALCGSAAEKLCPRSREPGPGDGWYADRVQGSCRIICSPVPELQALRAAREEWTDPDAPRIALITGKRYVDAAAHALAGRLAAAADISTGKRVESRPYDIRGYPVGREDPCAKGAAARWRSPDRPERFEQLTCRIPPEALKELDRAAGGLGCTKARLAAQLIALALDREASRQGLLPGSGPSAYGERLLEQDRRSGRPEPVRSALRELAGRLEKDGKGDR